MYCRKSPAFLMFPLAMLLRMRAVRELSWDKVVVRQVSVSDATVGQTHLNCMAFIHK